MVGGREVRLNHADLAHLVLMVRIRQAVTAQGLTVSALEPAPPELEDVFVAVLEEADL